MPMSAGSDAFARDCAALAASVAAARRAIGRGGAADLDRLGGRLTDLLAMAAAAPAAQRPNQLAQLLAVAEELEVLGIAIGDERRRCSEELARNEASARATAAYVSRSNG
jgi:hypothetical protein